MTGPLGRIFRRRVTAPDESPGLSDTADASIPAAASADGHQPVPDLPAGLDADALARGADVRRRGRARRRLRFLERAREVLLRDLGGLVLEMHRAGEAGRHDDLVAGKVARLLAVDAEARELAGVLGQGPGDVVLRIPGIGGTCPNCGELHASEARFCSRCGRPLSAGAPAGDSPTITPGDASPVRGATTPDDATGARAPAVAAEDPVALRAGERR